MKLQPKELPVGATSWRARGMTRGSGIPCTATTGLCREVPDVSAAADWVHGYMAFEGGEARNLQFVVPLFTKVTIPSHTAPSTRTSAAP